MCFVCIPSLVWVTADTICFVAVLTYLLHYVFAQALYAVVERLVCYKFNLAIAYELSNKCKA